MLSTPSSLLSASPGLRIKSKVTIRRVFTAATYVMYQTGRSISEQMKEHLSAYTNNALYCLAFTRRLLDSGHPSQGSHIRLMHQVSKGRLLNKLEEVTVIDTPSILT